MIKRTIPVLVVLLLLLFTSIACTPSKKPMQEDMGRQPGATTRTDGTASQQRATEIANEVGKIEGVNKAYVVISDSTGYIGLELERNIEGDRMETIQKEAETRAKAIDRSLNNVMVTSDMATVARIKKVADGIKNGTPIRSFANDLEDIGRRIKSSVR